LFALSVSGLFVYLIVLGRPLLLGLPGKYPDGLKIDLAKSMLALTLFGLPIIALGVATVSHGGMTYRYMLPMTLGAGLIVGYISSYLTIVIRVSVIVLILVSYGISSVVNISKQYSGPSLRGRSRAIEVIGQLSSQASSLGLPLVVSDGMSYLPMAYYSDQLKSARIYALTDPRAAVVFSGSDSVDLGLMVMRDFYPLHVESFESFKSAHREFILVAGDGGTWDWWPRRLVRDGYVLELISEIGQMRVYRVNPKSGTDALKVP
jgi:hypothetical protein